MYFLFFLFVVPVFTSSLLVLFYVYSSVNFIGKYNLFIYLHILHSIYTFSAFPFSIHLLCFYYFVCLVFLISISLRFYFFSFLLLFEIYFIGNFNHTFLTVNKGATVVVAKIQNSEQIVGGYNSIFWDSDNSNKATHDSFIFSLSDRNDIQSTKVGYSNGNQYSIRCYSGYVVVMVLGIVIQKILQVLILILVYLQTLK